MAHEVTTSIEIAATPDNVWAVLKPGGVALLGSRPCP